MFCWYLDTESRFASPHSPQPGESHSKQQGLFHLTGSLNVRRVAAASPATLPLKRAAPQRGTTD
jgi:hypothetical protein